MLAVEESRTATEFISVSTMDLIDEDESTQLSSTVLYSAKKMESSKQHRLQSSSSSYDLASSIYSSGTIVSSPFYVEDSVESDGLLLATSVVAAGFDIPHPDKAYKGGEDAWFVHTSETHTVLGVADGVSGWASVGVDPGLFSTAFMNYAKAMAEQGETDPVHILQESYTQGVVGKVVGSSTVCIAVIEHETRRLRAVNLGDSGFVVFRNGYAAFKSTEQEHYFNAPFQLTSLVGESLDFSHMRPHVFSSLPSEADYYEHDLEEGDRIMLATDGLLDNVHTDYLCHIFSQDSSPQDLAEFVCDQAFALSQDTQHLSPFAMGARSAGYPSCTGGKPDDITVVVAEIGDGAL